MHAVIVTMDVRPGREDESCRVVEEFIIPHVKNLDGFVSGTFLECEDRTRMVGVVLATSAETARRIGEDATSAPADAPAVFRSAEVHTVVATV